MHRDVERSGWTSHTERARFPFAWSSLLALLAGCGANHAAQQPDGGDGPRNCLGPSFCDGVVLRACNDGLWGAEIADCSKEGACSNGRCTSPGCAAAERDRTTFMGCLFYTVQVDNVASEATAATSFLASRPLGEAATVTLEQPGTDGAWKSIAEATVTGGDAARLSVPAGLEFKPSGAHLGGALRLGSSQPVMVEQILSDDGNNEHAASSGGTMLLPVQALGSHYRAMAYPQDETPAITAMDGDSGKGGAARMLVVGTRPGTRVTLTAAAHARSLVTEPVPSLEPTEVVEFTIGDGDVFQAWTNRSLDDLSGSEILATQPVAVFSGNIATTYGRTATGVSINSPDMAHEQMPPIFAWNHKYVAAALPPQPGTCDTLLGQQGASWWRLMAANNGTTVEFAGPAGGGALPGATPLDAGEVFDLVATGDFVVTSSGPLLVTQGIDCEPSLSLAIPVDKLLTDVTFAVLPSFEQEIAVARKQGVELMLDDHPVAGTMFLDAGGGYEVAHITLPVCPASKQVCTYHLKGKFGLTLRGMDVLASYALTVPASQECLDGADPICGPG